MRVCRAVQVRGMGIIGLWQALLLARAGHDVELVGTSHGAEPVTSVASGYAGAMLSPECEASSAPIIVRDQGRLAIPVWRDVYPGLVCRGSLVVSLPREARELARFARDTQSHVTLDGSALADLEPDLAGRFDQALFYPEEAHMAAPAALAFLREAVKAAGVAIHDDVKYPLPLSSRLLIDCRGRASVDSLKDLRGVRGERALLQARDVKLTRPIRLLHPRVALYIVPWPDDVYMVGATVIESDDAGPTSVRSALELLNAANFVHPGFAEAAILDLGAGVRPAFPDNIPKAIVSADGRTIYVNGAYRHGFLLAPMLAIAVRDHLDGRQPTSPLLAQA